MKQNSDTTNRFYYGWVIIVALLLILSVVLGTRISYGVFFKSIGT